MFNIILAANGSRVHLMSHRKTCINIGKYTLQESAQYRNIFVKNLADANDDTFKNILPIPSENDSHCY